MSAGEPGALLFHGVLVLTEFDAMADQIASDIGPVYAVTLEEAQMLARFQFPNESPEAIDGVAQSLYRSYCAEMWS
jgi:hypothetical protein